MNIRFLTVLVFVLIMVGGLGIFFLNEQNTKQLASRLHPSLPETSDPADDMVTVRSNDNRVSFQYPGSWSMTETSGKNQRGKFGPILQSWTLQNTDIISTESGVLAPDMARIIVTLQSGGSNLPIDALLDCTLKTMTCDKIGIDNEQFITSDTVLNTGMRIVSVATFYDENVLIGEGIIAPGQDQAMLTDEVVSILHSFKFSHNNPTSD